MKMVLKGNWIGMRNMLRGYSGRLDFVRKRAAYSLSEAFKNKLTELAPKGEEYEKYIKSLEVVQLRGIRDVSAFAVVSIDSTEKIGDILARTKERDRTVVYVEGNASIGQNVGIELLSDASPWPIDMLPSGIPRRDVRLIHKQVTDDEMEWAKQKTKAFIKENKVSLLAFGFMFGKVKDPDKSVDGMESMPDYATLALRAELGVNAQQVPHWRPAIKWVRKNVMKILEDDDEIKLALRDPSFRRHTFGNNPADKDMDASSFDKSTKGFRSSIKIA